MMASEKCFSCNIQGCACSIEVVLTMMGVRLMSWRASSRWRVSASAVSKRWSWKRASHEAALPMRRKEPPPAPPKEGRVVNMAQISSTARLV